MEEIQLDFELIVKGNWPLMEKATELDTKLILFAKISRTSFESFSRFLFPNPRKRSLNLAFWDSLPLRDTNFPPSLGHVMRADKKSLTDLYKEFYFLGYVPRAPLPS